MQKKDVIVVVLLFSLLLLWQPVDQHFIKPIFFPDSPETELSELDAPEERMPRVVSDDESPEFATPVESVEPMDRPALTERAPEVIREAVADPEVQEETALAPEEIVELSNEHMRIFFSSHGGVVREAILLQYDAFNEPDSPPVHIDFTDRMGLEIEGLSGLSGRYAFDVTILEPRRMVRFSRDLPYGLRFERTIELSAGYRMEVRDAFVNQTEQALAVPGYGVRMGPMSVMEGVTSTYGLFELGVDTLLPGGESVRRWGKDINDLLKNSTSSVVRMPISRPVDWAAAKNKYFVQSLMPRDLSVQDAVLYAERDGDTRDPRAVWATLMLPETRLAAGGTFEREMMYYLGPKKYDELVDLGFHHDRIMELGWWFIRVFAIGLMWGMTVLYGFFGNYGVAIMLLTIIIRIFFWPLTHKGTESMRRMQELAPLMKEMNEKYKDDAQKRQQAMMSLYKEHKVNPLGGCLPMIVQIPVFIGLFYLLRSAIELRYAGFLWIDDLSEPEGLLSDVLFMPLNILPILMAVTMYFQQKLTPAPTAGDPRQQQMHTMMMRVMPVMMLVLLYNFASGLALYWTTQNVLMIVQQSLYRRRLARRKAAEAATGSAAPAPAPAAPPPAKRNKNRRRK